MSQATRTIAVVTAGRSDVGLLRPVIEEIQRRSSLRLHLIATGGHLVPDQGLTVRDIEAIGLPVGDRVDMLQAADTAEATARAIGVGTMGFAAVLARVLPEILLVLGDRYEILAAVSAALPLAIPVAHIHGGESTVGAIDESIRHAVTKMSHLHFVSTTEYRNRVIQLGEHPSRVHLVGAPGLDLLDDFVPSPRHDLEQDIGLPLEPAPLLVTLHPETLDVCRVDEHAACLLDALDQLQLPVVFTQPNADTGGQAIATAIQGYVERHEDSAVLVKSLGSQRYLSLLGLARAMVGNSSSGIIEAASFGLPVVNLGERQRGRVRGPNVIDTRFDSPAIVAAIRAACEPGLRQRLQGMKNPYGDGNASRRIVDVLETAPLDQSLLAKAFFDLDQVAGALRSER